MSRKCPNCSADALESTKFCIKCGTKLPALAPSTGAATPLTPPSPPPAPARVVSFAEPVSSGDSASAPVKDATPPDNSGGVKNEVQSYYSAPTMNKGPGTTKSGGKGIIFAVIGIAIIGGGAFFFMSSKQAPTQVPDPAVTAAPVTPTTSPVKPASPAASVVPAAPKPAPKPAAPDAPASSAPDINKIMRDAANK